MSLLVSNSMFPIDIKYVEVPLKNNLMGILIVKTEEQEKLYGNRVKELHTQWVQPPWKENNELIRQAQVWEAYKGERETDFYLYRSLVLERFMKAWDIADDKGNPVPCDKGNIAKLAIPVANELIDQFINRNIPKEADLKN